MFTEAVLHDVPSFSSLSSTELIRTVEEGLPLDCLDTLRQWGLTFTEVGELVIPPRTVKHRKARGERLTTEETERFLRVVRVLELGDRVFGSRQKSLGWLRTADDRMNNRISLSLISTEAGAKLVEGQLWGIAEGVFS